MIQSKKENIVFVQDEYVICTNISWKEFTLFAERLQTFLLRTGYVM